MEDRDVSPGDALSPAESLALIERTLADTRRALGLSDWPFYLIWGLVWLVCFGFAHLMEGGSRAPLAGAPDFLAGLVWLAGVVAGTAATAVAIGRTTRGVSGVTQRVQRRVFGAFVVAFAAAGAFTGFTGIQDPQRSALFVLTLALLYLGMGAAFSDDVQLGLGAWLATVAVLGVASGTGWFHLAMAVLGGGGLLVAALVARRRDLRGAAVA